MQKVSIILVLLILASCKTNSNLEYGIIKGHITNGEDIEKIYLTNNDRDFKYEINLSDDGSFRDSLTIEPGMYSMSIGSRKSTQIVFSKGDDLTIIMDANYFKDSLKFQGQGSNENKLLQTINKKIIDWDQKQSEAYSLGEGDYKNLLSERQKELTALLYGNQELNPLFVDFMKRHIDYWKFYGLTYYQVYHRYYTKNPEFTISSDFLDEARALDFNSEVDYKASEYYYRLVMSEQIKRADTIGKSGVSNKTLARLKASAGFQSDYIKNDLLLQTIMGGLGFDNEFTSSYDAYMQLSTNPDHKNKVSERYNEVKSLEKGNLSPKFVNYENYNGGVSSLDDFKGKYVYIDVWATWCGPCKAEIPYLQDVEKTYHDNDKIAFISISVDKEKDHEKWKAMVKDKEMSGYQLIADNNFRSDFIEAYQVRGIPQFILIDPQGNIVNRNAPRPSSPGLIELFDDLHI